MLKLHKVQIARKVKESWYKPKFESQGEIIYIVNFNIKNTAFQKPTAPQYYLGWVVDL